MNVTRERYPDWQEVARELLNPIPDLPFKRGREGLTRLEILMLHVKAGRR